MQITVDTKNDSREHILKVIELLTHLTSPTSLNTENSHNNVSQDVIPSSGLSTSQAVASQGIFNLFDEDLAPKQNMEEASEETTDLNKVSAYRIEEERREPAQPTEIPMVIEYDLD